MIQTLYAWLYKKLNLQQWEDSLFIDDMHQSALRQAHPFSYALFVLIGVLFVLFILWASFASLDEVTVGIGKVVPSSQIQIVQNREGGLVEDILVKEGDIVEAGQLLLKLKNIEFSSSLSERTAKQITLMADISRLEAIDKKAETLTLPEEVKKKMPHLIPAQMALFKSKRYEQDTALAALRRRVDQREQEYKRYVKTKDQKARAYTLSKKELSLTKPLLKEGAVSEVEVLRLERQVNDKLGEKEASALDVPRAEAALEEAKQLYAEAKARQKSDLLKELAEKKEELIRLTEVLKSDTDRVERAFVKSPVKATVKRVLVHTLGGVITPGMDLVELVPLEDTLLVEAHVRPQDIAFLRPQQEAKVKITAYDFSIFGSLNASLEHISADTVLNDKGEAFYVIRVRTQESYLKRGEQKFPIIPGMIAQVDILTGKKTVLDYLLKPFNKMKAHALRER